MSRLARAGLLVLALPSLYVGIFMMVPQGATAALLAMKPGPFDRPLGLTAADFNQDGYDDLVMANTQAGTVTVLINQKNGTFLIQKNSPNDVGAATVSLPTLGPLFLTTGDINPEDVDGDRVPNDLDDCPNVYNPGDINGTQPDADGNGVGDACQTATMMDSDGDGVPDYAAGVLDNCPFIPNPSQTPETAAGLDGACGTSDDNVFLSGPDHICGTADDKPPNTKIGAACSRSADLIVLNSRTSSGSSLGLVRVRVNDGVGGLKSRSSLQASSGIEQGVLADLNGDSRLDLVVTNSGAESLLLFPGANNGEMGFVCLGGSNAGNECVAASQCPGGTCQLNEILFTSGTCSGGSLNGQACTQSINCPGGGFCRPSVTAGAVTTCAGGTTPGKTCLTDVDCHGAGFCRSPAGPEGVAVGDINGDDRPDIVYANRTLGNIGVLLNAGAASFASGPGSPFTSVPGLAFTDDHPIALFAARIPRTCAGGSAPGSSCKVDFDCAGGGICAGDAQRLCMGGAVPGTPCAVDQSCGAGGVCRTRSLDGDACADPVVLMQGPLSCLGGPSAGNACLEDQDCGAGGICVGHGRIQVFNAACPSGLLVAGQSIDLSAGHVPRAGAMVDFDRDGNLDLAVADFTGGQVLVFSGSASGQFASAPAVTLSGLAGPVALAPLNVDPNNGANIDLAVLGTTNNGIEVFHNTSTPSSLTFDPTPSLVTPWSDVTAMALFPADASIGQDLVLLHDTPPAVDVLSGTGSSFSGIQPERPTGPLGATGFALGDLRRDGLADLLLFDSGPPGTATPMISDLAGSQTERVTVPVGGGPVQAVVASLSLHHDDYDQDGVPDRFDNCPTRYNPPGCPANDKANFPECFVDIPCAALALALTGCNNPNAFGQCDNDNDGVGDQCEVLDDQCLDVDTDLDGIPDYNQFSKTVDNCPWIPNSSQDDSDKICTISGAACTLDADCGGTGGTCKGDGVGDICDSSICILAGSSSSGFCDSGPKENGFCRSDADCDAGVNDTLLVDRAGGGLDFLIGDASGGLRTAPASWSSIGGLASPVGAVVDRVSYNCVGGIGGFALQCRSRPEPGIIVAEQGGPGSADDALKLFVGDGLGGFTAPAPPVAASIPLQGDPTKVLVAADQIVCPNPWLAIGDLRYHFDEDFSTSVVAILETVTKSVGIYLPSNEGPAPPPADPNPLPLAAAPTDALFVDINQDDILDLVALSSGDGNPATPNLIVYIGLGNGLFFTDPSFNPMDVPDGMTFLSAGQVNISVDLTYPDVVLYDSVHQTPLIMTNITPERADIDQSKRIDGFDLVLLARAFGATRGEDFILEPDGTLRQNPDLGSSPAYDPSRLVVGSGTRVEGQDLPSVIGPGVFFCDRALDPLTGLYGLPVDVNLDGVVDGEDLAILASQFGKTF